MGGRKCNFCRVGFQSEALLEAHVQNAHKTAFPCPFMGCKETFASRTDKEEHYCNHFPPTASPQPTQQRSGPARQASNAKVAPAQYQANTNGSRFPTKGTSGQPQQRPGPARSGFPETGFARRNSPATISPLRTSASSSSLPRPDTSSSATVTSHEADLFHCAMCPQTFLNRPDLNLHMSSHIAPLAQHCEECNSSFPSIEEFNKHKQSRGNCSLADKQEYKCLECGKLHETLAGLQAHEKSVHKPSILAHIRAITAHMPPTAPQQTQQMHEKAPQGPAHQAFGGTGLQAHTELQQSPPSYRVQLPPAQQGRARPSAPLVYPIATLLKTRPAATPSPPRRASTKPPPQHYAPANAPRGPAGAATRGSSKPPSKPFAEATQKLQEISSRTTDLQLPDRPKYNLQGEIAYNDHIWHGVAFEHHDILLKALYWRCHVSIADRKTKSIPSAFDDAHSNDGQEDSAFELSPAPAHGVQKQTAVTLACHKVIVEGGMNEIVLLSVLDFFTGEVLLNHLVLPEDHVENWRTRITGFKEKTIPDAVEAGYAVLDGWKAARQALWLLIDASTVIVGYQLRETLDALRMIHGCGVDGAILVQEAAGTSLSKKELRLENLSRDLLGQELKSDNEAGRDCLEIAFAAREFVIWSTKNKEQLVKWGKAKAVGGDEEAELIRKLKEELAAESEVRQESSAENGDEFT
ncbi:uncharacterized protein BDZ99DRAFT_462676 [Mytilinidion resinicola]|uniref:C2H2-type domain-containing protein n=1 Tax=Mytilinidion resinicola TaxID=574789 RepID=A0A6A6YNA7_9PEZI|nr:uncharacterized protein BDZ99DRAFT_462676 [Mytilinidion resinicola]KAF2810063.1 hypothetical protein BDZ99DRAFT_462676 [Mytilinidion resinicola]